jgi:hypothetical protein
MMKPTILVLLHIFIVFLLPAQGNVELVFNPLYGNKTVSRQSVYASRQNDSLSIDVLKFYISGIELRLAGKTVWQDANHYYLMNLENKSMSIRLQNVTAATYDELIFKLGVDSVMSVSGALGGALDPTLGMYWAWQSGYINFKLEASTTQSTDHKFVLHIGGYSFPNKALRTIALAVKPNSRQTINLNLHQFFSALDFKSESRVMSPGKTAMKLADNALKMFSISKE